MKLLKQAKSKLNSPNSNCLLCHHMWLFRDTTHRRPTRRSWSRSRLPTTRRNPRDLTRDRARRSSGLHQPSWLTLSKQQRPSPNMPSTVKDSKMWYMALLTHHQLLVARICQPLTRDLWVPSKPPKQPIKIEDMGLGKNPWMNPWLDSSS